MSVFSLFNFFFYVSFHFSFFVFVCYFDRDFILLFQFSILADFVLIDFLVSFTNIPVYWKIGTVIYNLYKMSIYENRKIYDIMERIYHSKVVFMSMRLYVHIFKCRTSDEVVNDEFRTTNFFPISYGFS